MKNWLIRWVCSGVALAIVANIHIGVRCDSLGALAEATIVIGLANSLIRPILVVLTLPLSCLTFGLFGYVLNAALFWAVQFVVPGFHCESLLGAFAGPVLMGLIAGLLNFLLKDRDKD